MLTQIHRAIFPAAALVMNHESVSSSTPTCAAVVDIIPLILIHCNHHNVRHRHRNERTNTNNTVTNSPDIKTTPTTTRLFNPSRLCHCHLHPALSLQPPILFESMEFTKCQIMVRRFHLHSTGCRVLRSSRSTCRREIFQKQSITYTRIRRPSRSLCQTRHTILHLPLPKCIQ
jgi:hypothetical protein